MKGTLVIARRELLEKKFVFATAAAFALLAILIPLVPGVRHEQRGEVLVILSTIFASNFSIAIALILGASIVGRELSERRLSFYFSKPLPATSIWFGKVIGALLLTYLSAFIIASPALMAGVKTAASVWNFVNNPALITIVLAMPIASFLLAHVIATFVRSRSVWIAFDFIAATICGIAVWFLGSRLAEGFAVGLIKTLAIVLAVFFGITIVAAGAWQLASGRTDRARSHRELSRFLWISLGSAMLVLTVYVLWVISVRPSDLRRERFYVGANGGTWAAIGGQAKHRGDYSASFLYNLNDRRAIRVPPSQPWWLSVLDSNIAYWGVGNRIVTEIWMARLDTPNPKVVDTKIAVRNPAFFTVSPDGSRLMVMGRNRVLTVYDIASGASLGSARIPGNHFWIGFFVRPDLVRIYGDGGIFEYDVSRKVVNMTGALPARVYRFNDDRSRVLIAHEIHDARTGALIRAIPGKWDRARFLRDGRIIAISGDHRILGVFSATGDPLHQIPIPGGGDYAVDAGNGIVVIATRDGEWSSAVADVDRGQIVRVERAARPLPFGNVGRRLICESNDGLVVWDLGVRAAVGSHLQPL